MLEDVTIIIPAFHRRGYLRECLDGISANLPRCPVRIAQDDGGDCTLEGSAYETYYWAKLPYDSGLTAKRNAAVRLVETKYTLMGSDDFDFSSDEARRSITQFAEVLDQNKNVDVIAGRVNLKPYEASRLEYVPGEYIREHALDLRNELPFILKPFVIWRVDLAVNYFLARTEVLREVPWDETIRPIGGEHADWFLDLKAANKTVAFLPFANINTQPYDPSKQDSKYKEFRRRAVTTGHELFKKKRKIKQYISFDGGIS